MCIAILEKETISLHSELTYETTY